MQLELGPSASGIDACDLGGGRCKVGRARYDAGADATPEAADAAAAEGLAAQVQGRGESQVPVGGEGPGLEAAAEAVTLAAAIHAGAEAEIAVEQVAAERFVHREAGHAGQLAGLGHAGVQAGGELAIERIEQAGLEGVAPSGAERVALLEDELRRPGP